MHTVPGLEGSKISVSLLIFIFFKVAVLCGHASASDKTVVFYNEGMRKLCSFRAELAATPEEHEKGLMYRKSLAQDAAMLFIFKKEKVQFFWMKNTYIPLDMVFINSKLKVTGIYRSAKPFDEATVTSWSPAKYVLEINSGRADQCNIKIGTKIKFKNN